MGFGEGCGVRVGDWGSWRGLWGSDGERWFGEGAKVQEGSDLVRADSHAGLGGEVGLAGAEQEGLGDVGRPLEAAAVTDVPVCKRNGGEKEAPSENLTGQARANAP